MDEEQWLRYKGPHEMLRFLKHNASSRKLRLLACAWWRGQWHLLTDERLQHTIEVMERFADRLSDESERRAARLSVYAATSGNNTARSVFDTTFRDPAQAIWAINPRVPLIRELFGNPFHPVAISPIRLTWNDSVVPRLAQSAYDDRILPAGTLDNTRLLILADALEEAGCTDEQILTHLRGGGEHYRGCWVIDLLLGKS